MKKKLENMTNSTLSFSTVPNRELVANVEEFVQTVETLSILDNPRNQATAAAAFQRLSPMLTHNEYRTVTSAFSSVVQDPETIDVFYLAVEDIQDRARNGS